MKIKTYLISFLSFFYCIALFSMHEVSVTSNTQRLALPLLEHETSRFFDLHDHDAIQQISFAQIAHTLRTKGMRHLKFVEVCSGNDHAKYHHYYDVTFIPREDDQPGLDMYTYLTHAQQDPHTKQPIITIQPYSCDLETYNIQRIEDPFKKDCLQTLLNEYAPHARIVQYDPMQQEVDMSNNGLRELDGTFFKHLSNHAPYLHSLDLSRNMLTTLSEEIRHCTHLFILTLSNNHLRTIPTSIDQLTSLNVLLMSGNQLTELPSSLGNIKELRTITFAHNQLNTLPCSLYNLPNLLCISLAHNQFDEATKSDIEQLSRTKHNLIIIKNNPC
jgi:hypothetical protein